MNDIRRCLALLFGSVLCAAILFGCQPQVISGNKPEDRMNPVMSAHQRAVIEAHKQRDNN